MGDGRRLREQLLARIVQREEIDGLVEPRVAPSAKYKRWSKDEEPQPDISPGMRLIVRHGINPVIGYWLGVVLDYEEERGRWHSTTRIIVQVVKVSQPSLSEFVGRLRVVKIGGWHSEIVGFTPPLKKSDYRL